MGPFDNNQTLVEALIDKGVLSSQPIIDAFLAVDRKLFVPADKVSQAYGDYPLEIGSGQTISQPTTVAIMLELLEPQMGQNVLDVGSGSGWLSALLAYIVGPEGRVHGTEILRDVYDFGRANIKQSGLDNIKMHFTPHQLGWKQGAPYQRIVVSAGADDVPKALLEQLDHPGRMVIPIQDSLFTVTANQAGEIDTQKLYGFAFVPLVQGV